MDIDVDYGDQELYDSHNHAYSDESDSCDSSSNNKYNDEDDDDDKINRTVGLIKLNSEHKQLLWGIFPISCHSAWRVFY